MLLCSFNRGGYLTWIEMGVGHLLESLGSRIFAGMVNTSFDASCSILDLPEPELCIRNAELE